MKVFTKQAESMWHRGRRYYNSHIVLFLCHSLWRRLQTLLFYVSRFSFPSRVPVFMSIVKNTNQRNPYLAPQTELSSVLVHGQQYKRETIATREHICTVCDLTMVRQCNSSLIVQKCVLLMTVVVIHGTGGGRKLTYEKLFDTICLTSVVLIQSDSTFSRELRLQ